MTLAWIPTREEIQNIKVGSEVINCFGKPATVTEVYAQKDDIHGKAFVCFYSDDKGFVVSGSMKEGELVSTVALSGKYTHWQMLDLQAEMQASGELKREV